ncbi:glutathione S-transferase family protein [Shewanella polaris]|uniref:Glutathione S-transferase family protein n=1 Tax=Shewanella polaris TaxID=2588449 RepID=A0A4Y5YEB4_9GAMM|nr:glutathione S-transferase family protein [Shewanella polaris]QDE31121.1 glutathione S-transferase family protein [Shewanella polaris]
MLKFYFHPGPNPMKVALFLAETGLPFELVPVDTLKGEQHTAEFKAINPNAKTPAIEDNGVRVFDSNAILLYLADKTGKLASTPENRGELLSWLMFIATGLGPYSGQCVHFTHHAPEKIDYAANRYRRETQRHYDVLDAHLNNRDFIVCDELSIVDIAAWGWVDRIGFVLGEDALATYPNVQRWFNNINSRPSVEQARNMGKDIEFKSEFDDVAKRAFFPQNYAVANK